MITGRFDPAEPTLPFLPLFVELACVAADFGGRPLGRGVGVVMFGVDVVSAVVRALVRAIFVALT